ncbi:MAG: hypothetical protein DMF68_03140 [Acidobacteria bacterium]|nr:MAG: hypothetical protein DMF68_03140 [Acidobacteriota bacterium]
MSVTKRRSPVLSLLFLCAMLVVSFDVAHAERLPVRSYTSADGLGSNFINFLMRDSHGFLWFCTRDGLSRFDGARFVTYQVGNQDSPPGIEQIFETRKGIYWISTTGGVYRFDPNAIPVADKTSDTDRPTLNAERVDIDRASIYEDREGNLWIGGGALSLLEEEDGKVSERKVELNLPADASGKFDIVTMCEGKDGSLWLATSLGVMRRLPDGREILYSADFGQRMSSGLSILEDRTGLIWAGRASGIYIIKPEPISELSDPYHRAGFAERLRSDGRGHRRKSLARLDYGSYAVGAPRHQHLWRRRRLKKFSDSRHRRNRWP